MRFTLVLSLLLAVLAVIFALQNPAAVDIRFGPFDVTGSTALVLIVTFVLGVVVGTLAMLPSRFKHRKEVKTLRKQTTASPAVPPPAAPEPAMPPPKNPPEDPAEEDDTRLRL